MDRMTHVSVCCPLKIRKKISRAAILANLTTSAWMMQAASEKLGVSHHIRKRGRPRRIKGRGDSQP